MSCPLTFYTHEMWLEVTEITERKKRKIDGVGLVKIELRGFHIVRIE